LAADGPVGSGFIGNEAGPKPFNRLRGPVGGCADPFLGPVGVADEEGAADDSDDDDDASPDGTGALGGLNALGPVGGALPDIAKCSEERVYLG
jgi:hypothetical protein